MIKGVDKRFSQDTINIIKTISNLINLKICSVDLNILNQRFNCDKEELETKIIVINRNKTKPKMSNVNP